MQRFFDNLLGLYELLRLAVITRFRFGGSYWRWRTATAFGRGMPKGTRLVADVLEYARWVRRMRKGG